MQKRWYSLPEGEEWDRRETERRITWIVALIIFGKKVGGSAVVAECTFVHTLQMYLDRWNICPKGFLIHLHTV